MRPLRTALCLSATAAVFAACSDSPTQPDADLEAPPVAEALSDGLTGGNENFLFGRPLALGRDFPGPLNEGVAPRIEICRLTGRDCGANPHVVAAFDADDLSVDDGQFVVNWDTNGPETQALNPFAFYRIRVFLGDEELGFADVNPRFFGRPARLRRFRRAVWRKLGFLDFRIGRTIPISFWIGEGALCEGRDSTVIECQEFTIRDDEDFSAFIDEEGDRIGVEVPAGSLPPGIDFLNVTLERLDLPDGECIEGIDTPVFGPCGRVTTTPELDQPLELGATVAICVDTESPEFALVTGGQVDLLQIHRQTDDGTETQILANSSEGICGAAPPAGGAQVGPIAVAVDRVIRSVEALLAPRPLYAADLGLGGLTRRFSRFQWSLPCEIVVLDGVDDQTTPPGTPVATPPAAICTAANGQPVNGARIRFEVDGGNGSLVPPVGGFDDGNGVLTDVTASPTGVAAVGDWILGDAGANSIRLFGTGLLGEDDEFFLHQGDSGNPEGDTQQFIPVGEVFVNATAEEGPFVDDLIIIDDGAGVGNSLSLSYSGFGSFDLTVQAVSFSDEFGIGVPGVDVSWSTTGDGGAFAPNGGSTTTSSTDEAGFSTVTFSAMGADHVVTATVEGEIVATYIITNVPPALELRIPDATDRDQFGRDFQNLEYHTRGLALVVRAIQGGNPVDDVEVTWTIVSENGDNPVTGSFSRSSIVQETTNSTGDKKKGLTSVLFYGVLANSYVVEATAQSGQVLATFFLSPAPPAQE